MTVIIKIELKNSAIHEEPELIKRIVSGIMRDTVRDNDMANLFVAGYTVEVV